MRTPRLDFPKRSAWTDPVRAREYEHRRFRGPLQRLKQRHDERRTVELLGTLGPGSRVLDLPAGTGRLWPALRAAGHAVVGVDLSRAMLLAANEAAAGVPRIVADGAALPFTSDAFHAVLSVRFLFHLPGRAERVAFLAEMGRVARERVVVQLPWRPTLKSRMRALRGSRRVAGGFDREQLIDELGEAGLTLEQVRPLSSLFSDKALVAARPR